MAAPFASTADLAARWRPLSEEEDSRAEVLIDDASVLILDLAPDVEDRVSAVSLKAIVCAMVKRAMQSTGGMDGVTQTQQSAGPFSVGYSFANPSGDLYLTKSEKQRLRMGQRAFSVDLLAEDDAAEEES